MSVWPDLWHEGFTSRSPIFLDFGEAPVQHQEDAPFLVYTIPTVYIIVISRTHENIL